MFSPKVLRSDGNLVRKLRAMIAISSWVVFRAVLTSYSLAAVADIPTGKPQIQGANPRIEFDNRLPSRVVARFDKTETAMGRFSASETVTTADKPWTGLLLTSQKHGRTKDAFREVGGRLIVEGKAGPLTKMVSVTSRTARPRRPQLRCRGLRHRKKPGTVSGHSAHLPVEFDGSLLLKLQPQ
jgi:hypothetical protein